MNSIPLLPQTVDSSSNWLTRPFSSQQPRVVDPLSGVEEWTTQSWQDRTRSLTGSNARPALTPPERDEFGIPLAVYNGTYAFALCPEPFESTPAYRADLQSLATSVRVLVIAVGFVPVPGAQAVSVLIPAGFDGGKAGTWSDVASKPIFITGADWRALAGRLGIDGVLRVGADGQVELTDAMRARVKLESRP